MLKNVKEKGWNMLLTMISKLGINTLSTALKKRLPDDSPEEEIVVTTTPYFIETIDAMGDSIPNKTQIPAIWLRYLQNFMIPFLFRLFQPVIARINESYNRRMIQYLADSSKQIGLFLTDEIKPDHDQIDGFVDGEIAKKEVELLIIDEFVGGNLAARKADPTLSLFIQGALKSLWKTFVTKEDAVDLQSISMAQDGSKVFIIDGYEVTIKKLETI